MTEHPVTPRLDPQRLALLLQEAGWRVAGHREGAYVRLAPPNEQGASVIVPLDRSAPEFDQTMSEALSDVQRFVSRNTWTSNLSGLLNAEPTDGFRFRAQTNAPRGLIPWTHGERLIQHARLVLAAGAKAYIEPVGYFGNRFGQFANRYLDTVLMGQTSPGSYIVTAFAPSSALVPLTAGQATTDGHFHLSVDAAPARAIGVAAWTAVQATTEAIARYRETDSLSAFAEMVPRGVSYEMTVALSGLVEGSDGAEISVEWDPAIPAPADVPEASIELHPTDIDVLAKASNQLLEKVALAERASIIGWVHLLTRREADGPGVISVENLFQDKPKRVRVHLNDDEYRQAVQAHDEARVVIVEGAIEREGNVYWMYHGRLVSVLSSVDELRSQLAGRAKTQTPGESTFDDSPSEP
jgi:hypothetical protein